MNEPDNPGQPGQFAQYRGYLFGIAYRMTGSAMDAEDIVQEAFVRFLAAGPSGVENPRSYLATITTRLALNQLASSRVRRETYLGSWLPEPLPGSDQPLLAAFSTAARDFDSISMAFMVLLESLTPAERAVFLLRAVFDYSYAEIAGMLQKSEGACRKLFSRAKTYVAAHTLRGTVDPAEHQSLLELFISAAADGDVDSMAELLAQDATLWADGGGKVRGAATRPLQGRETVARFLIGAAARLVPAGAAACIAEVNGLPALLLRDAQGAAVFVAVIEARGGEIAKVWAIANPDKLRAL